MNHAVPKHCTGCIYLWTRGVKDGKHDRWCSQYSKSAPKAVGECKLKKGKKEKVK